MSSVSPEILQAQAVRYVCGAMPASEREAYDVILKFHAELRELVGGLEEVVGAVTLAEADARVTPAAGLKARVLGALALRPPRPEPEALVATDAAGLIEWVNPAFTALCGYELAELKGRKPGHFIQGPETDPAALARIRTALHTRQPCRETLVNYHKDGTSYRADIRIAPVLDDDGEPLWFVARERKVSAS